MITSERDYVAYYYNLLLLYTSLYILTRIALESENNDEFEINEEGNWIVRIEEQPKVRADVYQKSYEYDERDRLLYARDNFSLYSIYRYDESGERSNKYNYFSEEETLYANRYYSTSINSLNREYEGQSIKYIFLNNERLVTKTALNKINGLDQAYSDYEKSHTYYYHSDHLGSATLITDYKGKEYQRIEYTPYGESWIELSKNIDNYLPYKFTGKELDEETGFYYYGQRYLDPRYSIWHTSDPAIYDYMSQSKDGEGGIYNVTNLNLYHYAGNNPVKYIDPDGKSATNKVMGVGGAVVIGVEISYATFTLAEIFEKYGVVGGGIMLLLLLLQGDTQPNSLINSNSQTMVEPNILEPTSSTESADSQVEATKGQIEDNAGMTVPSPNPNESSGNNDKDNKDSNSNQPAKDV